MKTKHTKGEWTYGKTDNFEHLNVECNGKLICSVYCGLSTTEEEQEEAISNTKLIATAPELLDALRVCYASLSTYGPHPIIEKQVENAIKKATK